MKDLPERLRTASGYALMDNARATVLEAADEIERLRGTKALEAKWRAAVEGMTFFGEPVQDMTAERLLLVVGHFAIEYKRLSGERESGRVIHSSDCKSDGIDMSGGRREVQFLHPASDPPSTPQVPRKLPRLLSGLQELINRHSAEAGSNTPDYVLADFLDDVRHAFDAAVNERERWHGRANHDAAPAARASDERPRTDKADLPSRPGTGDTREPVAWGVIRPDGLLACASHSRGGCQSVCFEGDEVVPLYRSPTLTEAEREAAEWALREAVWSYNPDCGEYPATLRGLLERLK